MQEKTKAQAKVSMETGVGALRPGTAVLVVEEGIALKSLQESIARVVGIHGCMACGLAGLDLHFRVQEKLLVDKFRDIEGLRDVAIIR